MTMPRCPDVGLAKLSKEKKRPGKVPGPWCVFSFLVKPTKNYFTARPYCCAWSAVSISGLAPSTSAHGPFTVGADCNVPVKFTVIVPSTFLVTLIAGLAAASAKVRTA